LSTHSRTVPASTEPLWPTSVGAARKRRVTELAAVSIMLRSY
jgi:hypothetical protein